jgi:hypothetical protein
MKYAELSDEAKERARDWYKETENQTWGTDRAPDLYEDLATCCSHLGITISERTRHWRNRTTGKEGSTLEYDIEWSGFWSQGDGLVIKGEWNAEDVDMDALQDHVQDDKLTAICAEMTALKLRWPQGQASITTVSAGPGLPYMALEETSTDPDEDDAPLPEDDKKALKRLIERACDWCYRQLQDNYEYDTGDEAAGEAIEANEYEFDEDGALGLGAHA